MNALVNKNYSTPPTSPVLQPVRSSTPLLSPVTSSQEDLLIRQNVTFDSLSHFTLPKPSTFSDAEEHPLLPSPLSPYASPQDFFALPKASSSHINYDIQHKITREHSLSSDYNFIMVDDNQINLTILSKILTKSFNISTLCSTTNPTDVLDLLHANIYDVLFLDIEMPQLNGIQIAQTIRSMPLFDKLTIIAVTSCHSLEDHAKYRSVGIDHTVPKPIVLDGIDFKAMVLQTMEKRK